jgi:pyrimidine-specific ribonucleoside hydrolase
MSERSAVSAGATRGVLRVGVAVSAAAFVIALLVRVAGHAAGGGDAFDPAAVLAACAALDPWGWATLGVLAVIATPILAIAATGHEHRVAGDRRTAGLSVVVLAILGFSLAIALSGTRAAAAEPSASASPAAPAAPAASPAASPDDGPGWIIDTDMGGDDIIALVLAARTPGFRIAAVSASTSGLGSCDRAHVAIRAILVLIGTPNAERIPIGCDRGAPLQGYGLFPDVWRREIAALLIGSIEEAGGPPLQDEDDWSGADSTRVVAEVLLGSDQPLPILELGPMTVLARLLDADPSLASRVERVVAMGGAFDVPGNVRVPGFTEMIPNTTAEWNLFADPVAAQIVVTSGVPVTFVPLDATRKAPLRAPFRAAVEALADEGSVPARLVRAVLDRAVDPDAGEYYHWDPLATLVATGAVPCRMEDRTVRIIADPGGLVPGHAADRDAIPWTDWRGAPRVNLDAATAGSIVSDPEGTTVRACMDISVDRFEDAALEILAAG